jgi:NCS1 family nucleobase:cation symporter-1
MIADYYFIRKERLHLKELYQHKGRYLFGNGFNSKAIIALVVGIVPNIPGFLANIHLADKSSMPAFLLHLYDYAWFVGFFISGLTYWLMMRSQTEEIIETINIREEDYNVGTN